MQRTGRRKKAERQAKGCSSKLTGAGGFVLAPRWAHHGPLQSAAVRGADGDDVAVPDGESYPALRRTVPAEVA